MLAIEHVSSLRVIESLWSWIPVHHLEFDAIVVGVTFDACLPRRSIAGKRRMQTPVAIDFSGDLAMAIETLE